MDKETKAYLQDINNNGMKYASFDIQISFYEDENYNDTAEDGGYYWGSSRIAYEIHYNTDDKKFWAEKVGAFGDRYSLAPNPSEIKGLGLVGFMLKLNEIYGMTLRRV